ncbi:MAG: YfcE family phosphodiesterase [Chloroflexi bacterium]|nr:YfcE family phosphodiesterase [Chloroflexota bacterium]
MRLLLIADVHANWEALIALQRAEPKPDAVLFAGDAVGYGPDPADCARWLLANTTGVRGNHDEALARPNRFSQTCRVSLPELEEAARETLDYSRAILAPGDLDGLRGWPLSAASAAGGARFYVTHGSPADPLGGVLNPATCPEAELEALFDGIAADVIVLGHTHMPAIRKLDGRLIVNPGSLGQPRYGTPDATYAVWSDGDVQIRHLHYDHDATARRLRLAPLSPEVVEQLTDILETGMV